MGSSEPRIDVRERVPLAPLTTLGVGGPARWLACARSPEDLAAVQRFARERDAPLFVLGGGSNVVVADEGFPGCVVQIAMRGVRFDADGEDTLVTASAGEPWDALVDAIVRRGLGGVECLSGIPGSVGGTPIQNVGAYGQEVSGTIERVTVFDRATATVDRLPPEQCELGYRTSRFKTRDAGRFIVCDVTYRVRPGVRPPAYPEVRAWLEAAGRPRPGPGDVREAVLAIRRRKGMVVDPADPDTRSVGSFFMNPVVTEVDRERIAAAAGELPPGFPAGPGRVKVPAAWLIERAGFARGTADGAVGVSSRHALAIVNRGGATARDVLRLAARMKLGVRDRFGVWLLPEPIFVGWGGEPDLEFLQKAAE